MIGGIGNLLTIERRTFTTHIINLVIVMRPFDQISLQSICERFGATIVWKARAGGGLVAELQIPLLHTNLE